MLRNTSLLILTTALAVTLADPVLASGGLECVNEPPGPMCTCNSPWIALSAGFGATASLTVGADTSNGNVRLAFRAGGQFPFGKAFTIYHNSRDSRLYRLGEGRTHSFNVLLLEHPAEWSPTDVRIVLPNGYRVGFDENLDGTFRGEPGVFSRLEKDTDGSYRLYTNDSPDMVDDGTVCYRFGPADGTGRARLLSRTDSSGTIVYTYVSSGNGLGELERIREESSGQEAVLAYDSAGRLQSVTSMDSVVTSFSYHSSGDLSEATSSWGTLTFTYDTRHNIRTVTDGSGGHSAEITYVGSARGSEFRDTAGQMYDFAYTTDSSDSVTAAVFGPRGTATTTYEFGANRLITAITAPGAGRVCYTYNADKCLTGQTYCSVPGAIRMADSTEATNRPGS